MSLGIIWLRRDLRLSDNPALAKALASHARVLPVYIHAPEEEGPWAPGAASRWWLHHALADLTEQLDGRLVIRRGGTLEALQALIADTGAAAVYWNRLYEPAVIERDKAIKQALRAADIGADSGNAALLFEPWAVQNRQGNPFRVFTPFWKQLLAVGLPQRPIAVPSVDSRLVTKAAFRALDSVPLDDLGLLPSISWDTQMAETWHVSREGADARLEEFLETDLKHYAYGRDLPARDQVSRLSPYLHFGQLGPREVVAACRQHRQTSGPFLREIGWREFAHHLLYHFPHTTDAAMDTRFDTFPWRDDEKQLRAWQCGRTGVPLVDAGMRQLWATGWMHNRVRMIVASFLTKNLLLPWQDGARWFWDTLVDADLASNSLGWQWTAGCGADAAPYFRVFNPLLQGEKFDKEGGYIRRWVPELARLPDKWIHQPWEAPEDILARSEVRLGDDYPRPLVDLKASRQRALGAWSQIK